MALKNSLLKACLKLFSSQHVAASKPKRILVVTTTALGDTIWATPALDSLKSSFPNAYIAVLTSPIGVQVLKGHPAINRFHLLQEPVLPRFFSLLHTLKAEQFDTILLFHASQRLVLPLCTLLGAARIVGTAGINKDLDSLLTDPLPPTSQHEIARRLQIVEHIGGKATNQLLSFHFLPKEQTFPLSPEKHHSQKRWVALHPGSKDSFKRWPAENFIQVGRYLQEHANVQILITGTKSEEPLMRQIASQIPHARIHDPNLPLRSFASILAQLDLLISNDTGPVHLACALNRPVVAIYSSTNPNLCGPYKAPNAIAVARPPTCTPCLARKCRTPFCFLQIGPDEVIQAAQTLLKNTQRDTKIGN